MQLQLLQELGREPKIDELALGMDTTPDKVENLLEISRRPVSLETPIDDEGDSTFGDFVEDSNSPAPSEEVATHLLHVQLQQALDKLPDRAKRRSAFALRAGRWTRLHAGGSRANDWRHAGARPAIGSAGIEPAASILGACDSQGLLVRSVASCARIPRPWGDWATEFP